MSNDLKQVSPLFVDSTRQLIAPANLKGQAVEVKITGVYEDPETNEKYFSAKEVKI